MRGENHAHKLGGRGEKGERREGGGENHAHNLGRLVQVTVTIDSPRQSTVVQYNVLLRTMVSGGPGGGTSTFQAATGTVLACRCEHVLIH